MAPTTRGTRPPLVSNPTPRCSRCAMTPKQASSPNALPPASTTAWTRSTRCPGSSRSRPRMPEAPPRTSTAAVAPAGASTAVHPVRPARSVAWPTRSPATSVRPPMLTRSATAGRPFTGAGAGRPARLLGGQASGRDLAGEVEAPLDQGPDEGDVAGRLPGIGERPGDRRRERRRLAPPQRGEHVGLVLEPPLPPPSRGRVEPRLDHAVDHGGAALRLERLAQDEAALARLEPLEPLAREARRVEEPSGELRGLGQGGRALEEAGGDGRGCQRLVEGSRRRPGRPQPGEPAAERCRHRAVDRPGRRFGEQGPRPARRDLDPGERGLGAELPELRVEALLGD